MSGLVQFRNIADEITIRESDGVAVVSTRGAARLVGRDESTLREHFKGAGNKPSKMAEMLLDRGFEGAGVNQFSDEGIPDEALGVILKYYAYKAGRWCTQQAEYACDQFMDIGIRSACYLAKGLFDFNGAQKLKQARVATIAEIKDATEFYRELYGDAYAQSYGPLMMEKHQPHLLGPAAPAKERSSLSSADALLTPTEIAAHLDMTYQSSGKPSPRAANSLLEAMGYQVKIDKQWTPTEKGKPFSVLNPVSTDSKSDKFQLFWKVSILDELRGEEAA